MKANKFKLSSESMINEAGVKLFRIVALTSFSNIAAGDVGGWVKSEANLSQTGNAWVLGDAQVTGDAQVYGDAQVTGNAHVSGNAHVTGNAHVSGNVHVSGNAQVYGNARVTGDAQVSGNAWVTGDAQVYGDAQVTGNAWVTGDAQVYGDAQVTGDAQVYGCGDIISIHPIGSEAGTFTAFKCSDGDIICNRGCFNGSLDDFTKAVAKTHGDNEYGKQYTAVIELVKIKLMK